MSSFYPVIISCTFRQSMVLIQLFFREYIGKGLVLHYGERDLLILSVISSLSFGLIFQAHVSLNEDNNMP